MKYEEWKLDVADLLFCFVYLFIYLFIYFFIYLFTLTVNQAWLRERL